MPGLVIDIYIEFVVRSGIILFWRLRSGSWIEKAAHVTSAVWKRASFGCDTATVRYAYSVDETEYNGTSVEPFPIGGNPDGPVKVLPRGTTVQIRYDPRQPTRSVLVERWWLTRRVSKS